MPLLPGVPYAFMRAQDQTRQNQSHELQQALGLMGVLAQMQRQKQVQAQAAQEQELRAALASGDTEALGRIPGGIGILKELAQIKNTGITGALHQAQTADLQRRAGEAEQQGMARGALANLLSPSGSFGQGTEMERPTARVFANDAEAIRAMQEAEAKGVPFTGNVPNPGNVQALALQADPQRAIPELLRQQRTPPVGQSLAPRVVQDTNSPTGWGYLNPRDGTITPGAPVPSTARPQPQRLVPMPDPNDPTKATFGVPTPGAQAFPPPESADAAKARREAEQASNTAASVRERIDKMGRLIQGGSITGGVVGPLGIAGRAVETAQGVVQPSAPTPAIDYQNELRLLQSDVRKMVEKDPNLSKDEREALYETLGGGTLQTPGSAIRALNNVLAKVENAAATGRPRATGGMESAVRAAGWTYEPTKYEYRVVDGKVQRKAK